MQRPINLLIPDAVQVSGISRSRLYEALREKKLRAIKAGRRTLIPVAELEAYLASLPSYGEGE
jgi:excisionase family DNA binding protein